MVVHQKKRGRKNNRTEILKNAPPRIAFLTQKSGLGAQSRLTSLHPMVSHSGSAPPKNRLGETSRRLFEDARRGDPTAIDAIFQRYLGPLQRWARGRLPLAARNLLDTDDLVQETMLRSLRVIDRFEPERTGAFLSYLRRVLINRLRDELRGRALSLGEDSTSTLPDKSPSPIEEAVGRELWSRYEQGLARLNSTDQELIILRVEMDFSHAQVALAVGKPSQDAARMATKRALVRLAREMSVA